MRAELKPVEISAPVAERESAEALERRIQGDLDTQFDQLRNQARAVFAAVKGRRGLRNEKDWQTLFDKAGVEYRSGKFLIQQMGPESYLDPKLTAVLTRLRADLLGGVEAPTASQSMAADSAIMAYRNMLRVQGWIGSICLVVERELFGQAPLNEIHGSEAGERLVEKIARLEEVLMPLLDRCQRMMLRAISELDRRRPARGTKASVMVAQAGQVNMDCVFTSRQE